MHDPAFLETADRIGARLCRDALWSGNQCNWLGWALDAVGASWTPVHRVQTCTIYDGTAGIALFLGRLYEFTHDRLQKDTAIGAINHAMAASAEIPEQVRPGFYGGAAGIAFATLELGKILDDSRMMARGLRELKKACSGPPNEAWVDVIGGSAGTIQLLLDVASRFDQPELVDLALAHGAMLLRAAKRTDAGWSWDTLQGQSEQHLCGYGHGAGGIGCALLELWAETGEEEYRYACLSAFRYERSHFSAEHHNWPDLRNMTGYMPPGQQAFAMAWCHGGPGIGLARLRALELLDAEEDTARDLNEALQITVTACSNVVFPNSGNLCLCHGLGGNADLLIAASDIQGRHDLRLIAENVGRQAIAQIRMPDLPWPCGVTTGGETPNLMIGLSGIGHFFLRLHDSVKVPSLLLVRPGNGRKQVEREQAVAASTGSFNA
ncbi:MAG TPA: lanthionine synthetase LanC family protein [Bryobacteraceae bacterium]|jgi:lantibiotic modifying enzyme|nr:lanthionine synthetase LanC family protein [Bryobacteraceae bacterium]